MGVVHWVEAVVLEAEASAGPLVVTGAAVAAAAVFLAEARAGVPSAVTGALAVSLVAALGDPFQVPLAAAGPLVAEAATMVAGQVVSVAV